MDLYDRLVQCIVNLKIHTHPEFSLHEGTLVMACGWAYQTMADGLLESIQDTNHLINFCNGMRHRLTEAVNNVIADWSYLKSFVDYRFTKEAFERVRQEFPQLFEEGELPNDLLDRAQEMMIEANQWTIQYQNLIDSLDIVEELPPVKEEEDVGDEDDADDEEDFDDEEEWDEEDLAGLNPLDIELLRGPVRYQVESMLPSYLNPIRWLDIVRKFLYHSSRVLITIHSHYKHSNQHLRFSTSKKLHFEYMDLSEFLYCLGVYLVKLRKPLEATTEAFYIDHLRWFYRLRQVVEREPQNERLIRLTHCMVGIVERRYEMTRDMLEDLNALLVQCGRDFERTLTGTVHRVLDQLEWDINNDDFHQLDLLNCGANLLHRAEDRLEEDDAIKDMDDYFEVDSLLEQMDRCYRNMNTNLGYLEMIRDRAEGSTMVRDIFENALATSPLRYKPMYANVTLDQIIDAAQTVINQLSQQIQQLRTLANEYAINNPIL